MQNEPDNIMAQIRRSHGRTENQLARLDPAAMHAVGAHYAEIRVKDHAIAVSTESDAENVRDYVESNTTLVMTHCYSEGRGYVLTFRDNSDAN